MEGLSNVICSLGSNLGDRAGFLKEAIIRINVESGKVINQSRIYETPPLGFQSTEKFLNMCISVRTLLNPLEFIATTQKIEKDLGRIRKDSGEYESRKIDIDIIFFEDKILNAKELILPHPLFRERKFILLPLIDLDGNMIDPVTHLTIHQILLNCKDKSAIKVYKKNVSISDKLI